MLVARNITFSSRDVNLCIIPGKIHDTDESGTTWISLTLNLIDNDRKFTKVDDFMSVEEYNTLARHLRNRDTFPSNSMVSFNEPSFRVLRFSEMSKIIVFMSLELIPRWEQGDLYIRYFPENEVRAE